MTNSGLCVKKIVKDYPLWEKIKLLRYEKWDWDHIRAVIYEPAFYFYMIVPDDFELESKTFLEDGSPEYLEWVPFDTEKTVYPEFFKTELNNPSRETKYIVADERSVK